MPLLLPLGRSAALAYRNIARACRSCKHLKQLGIDSTNQVSRHVLMEIKKTFPNLATKTRP